MIDTFKFRFTGFIGPAEKRWSEPILPKFEKYLFNIASLIGAKILTPVMFAFINEIFGINASGISEQTQGLKEAAVEVGNFILSVLDGVSTAFLIAMVILALVNTNWSALCSGRKDYLPDGEKNYDLGLEVNPLFIFIGLMDYPLADNSYCGYLYNWQDIQGIEIGEKSIMGHRCLSIMGTPTTVLPDEHSLNLKRLWAQFLGCSADYYWFPEELFPEIVAALNSILSQDRESFTRKEETHAEN